MIRDQYIQLSIIVPVYNVEKYIRPCIESIFMQELDEDRFEVIIVNDGTKDRSMEIIQDIICEHKNITIINQENQSLSVARNNGIAVAKGEYIIMPDSDDLLIKNSLKPLLDKALETEVDMLVADFLTMNDQEIEHYKDKLSLDTKEINYTEMSGEQLIIKDLVPHECYVWRTLYNRSFLFNHNLTFYPGITYQDRPFTYACLLKANKCIRAYSLLNIYRKGHSTAASFRLTKKKAFDYCISIAEIWKLVDNEKFSKQLLDKISDNISNNIAILTRRIAIEIKSKESRMEVIDFLNQITPTLSLHHGFKQRIQVFFLKKAPHTYIIFFYLYANLYEGKISPFIKHHFIRYLK